MQTSIKPILSNGHLTNGSLHPSPGVIFRATPPVPSVAVNNRAPTDNDVLVGARIKALRRDCGRTQKQLAASVGVTGAQFHRYESGATRVATSRLLAIAKALNVQPEAFIGGVIKRPDPVAEPEDGATDELVELVDIFSKLTDRRRRKLLLTFARAVAKGQATLVEPEQD
jgi:transcriptional regulator with XRE-family HTH domain